MAMETSIRAAAAQMKVCGERVERLVGPLDQTALTQRPPRGNSLLWLWGHLANSRRGLARMLGGEIDLFEPELFGRGSEPQAPEAYPDKATVEAAWREGSEALRVRLESITAEELAADSPRDFPIEDKSLAGTAAFLAWHEAYHLGQMVTASKAIAESA